MNKRLVILLSIFFFIVLVILLSSTVFSFQEAQVNFLSTTNYLVNEKTILDSAHFEYGESIFFIDREEYIENLELNNPYIKVISLELVFPNKVVIHAIERNEVFAFKLSDNTYVICDEELKVLAVKQVFVNTTSNAILVSLQNLVPVEDAVVGTVLTLPTTYSNIIKNFIVFSKEWDSDLLNLRGNIERIELNYEEENNLRIEMRQGVEIIVLDSNLNLSNKLQLSYSVYDSASIDRTKGIILIIEQQNEEIIAMYDDGE